MPGRIDFKLQGAKEFERLLKQLGLAAAGRLGENALAAAARVIAAEARRRAPVRSGTLRKSITVSTDRELRQAGGTMRQAFVRARAPHAHLLEFGTSRMSARAFLRPAADEAAGAALNKLAENLGKGLSREALRLAAKVGAKRR